MRGARGPRREVRERKSVHRLEPIVPCEHEVTARAGNVLPRYDIHGFRNPLTIDVEEL